jgi:hypothetical protein
MSNDEMMQNIHNTMDEIHESIDMIRVTVQSLKNEMRIFTFVYAIACGVASFFFLGSVN